MTRKQAKDFLLSKFPRQPMEIEEYLSWAPVEKFDEITLWDDFREWLSK